MLMMKVALMLLRELLLTIGDAPRCLRECSLQKALSLLQGLQTSFQGALLLQSGAHSLMRHITKDHFVELHFTNQNQQSEEEWGLCVHTGV